MKVLRYYFLCFVFVLGSSLFAQEKNAPEGSDPLFNSVLQDFSRGQWQAGRAKLESLSENSPNNSDLLFLWGKYFHQINQYDKARYHLQKALKLAPGNLEAKQLLVNVETATRRYSSAICYVNELLEVNPYWKNLWLKKIEIYEAQGNFLHGEKLLKRLFQIYPEDPEIRQIYLQRVKEKSITLSKGSDLTGAITLKVEILSANPRDVSVLNSLFNDYVRSGQIDKALALMDQAIYLFPNNNVYLLRKVGILASQQKFSEVLYILEQKLKRNPNPVLRRQYNYYTLEAARYSKALQPEQLYGKIFESNPSNTEAFSIVYNAAVSAGQYDEALSVLLRHRRYSVNSKSLEIKELNIYKLKGDELRFKSKVRELYAKHPSDEDLAYEFAKVIIGDARASMESEDWKGAIDLWSQVREAGDLEMKETASNSLINAYINAGKHDEAIRLINETLIQYGESPNLRMRLLSIHFKNKNYILALEEWNKAMDLSDSEQQLFYRGALSELVQPALKELAENYNFDQERALSEQWKLSDPENADAYKALTAAYLKTKDIASLKNLLDEAISKFPADVFFSDKQLSISEPDQNNVEAMYYQSEQNLQLQPYAPSVQKTFVNKATVYGQFLLKEKQNASAIEVLDKALKVEEKNLDLIYLKGTAFEQEKVYDSAYTYLSRYTPAVAEAQEFKQRLLYLKSNTYQNELGISHLFGRFQDTSELTSVSGITYTRKIKNSVYGLAANYAGRITGQGVQLVGSWERTWSDRVRTAVSGAYANKLFNTVQLSATGHYQSGLLGGTESKLAVGYRALEEGSLLNLTLGVNKELEDWLLDFNIGNYLLRDKYLYNISFQARHYLASPKNYLLVQSGIGTVPQVEVLNTGLYSGFNADNFSFSTGLVHLLSPTLSGGIIGSIYHYKAANGFRNLYNLNLSLNVRF